MSEPQKSPAEIAAEKLAHKKEVIRAYQSVFKGKDAEIVLEDLRKRSFYDFPTRALPGEPEYKRDQNEGCRLLFLHIKSRIKADPTKINLTPED